ncbi:Stk1 family PASTA domain-containing Ser/Thr kinase [Megasphaera paucivorans]|uniref:non-specific serine/threonine protein kinase n=1 Tax=Megasphaera paucivorans TaxID=349095 RepID=A0A1G9VFV2_9FIRM|nr:Stk1 family PASTA domain-containing Ser/Thr kinase [Megasphaera paucivorans]SDM71122.1 serine/threonine protein kinase [Megasphaera paucivorans]
MIGHILDNRYKILEKVGSGGMACVYKAQDILLDRIVAVKILHEKLGNDHDFLVRFRQEAQAAAKLSHPNIVNIYDVGYDENVHYIVMEYIRGETLKEFIEKHGHLPINNAIQITFDIGEALEHAHSNGIIHCDIKPHNILVTESGHIKVADFGIARAVNSTTANAKDGSILGSVHYFSPEQASGGKIDERTDIYSLGVVMYEMMTGVVPFHGDTAITVALQHVQDEIPLPSKYNRRIPQLVERCILKAMAKNPDDRFQSVSEMMAEMRLAQGFVNPNKGALPIIKNNFNTQKIQPVKIKEPNKANVFTRIMDNISNHSKKSIIMAMLGVFVVAFLWAFFSFGNFWSTEEITVPDVTGKQVEIAKQILTKKNLNVSIKEMDNSDVPIGQVITQTPTGGSVVKAKRTIYLTVSKGHDGSEVLIPDLRGLTLDEAKLKLKDIGLSIGHVVHSSSSKYKEGTIMSQSPSSPKKVPKDTSIDVVVCENSETKDQQSSAPNVIGMPLDAAVKALESAGYSAGTIANIDNSKDTNQAQVTMQSADGSNPNVINLNVEYNKTTADDKNNNQEAPGTTHTGTVNISVPAGASSQHVQIIVSDDNGSHVVYDRNQSGGDSITKNISGTGKTRVRVYINNSLVQDKYI